MVTGTERAIPRLRCMDDVTDNRALQRYELSVEGEIAHADYEREGDTIIFTHTIVPPGLQGRGVGTRLIEQALADVRARGLRVVPRCAFVAAFLRQHPDAAIS
jgi:predicted GNAT family acetyltransferase